MAGPAIAVFCTAEEGHFKLLRPLISGLARLGFVPYVYTHGRFGAEVGRAGGILIDVFAQYSLDRADSESLPLPCRYVSFAGAYAEEIVDELKRIDPVLIIYETFAVIGRVAAQQLGLPYVNVSAGHNMDPGRHLPMLEADPRVRISESCRRAVEDLRERYGVKDASPFCYVSGLSPYLNIYCEPPGYLTEDERKVFEPLAFFGCLPSPPYVDRPTQDEALHFFHDAPERVKVYACFGTTVFRYYADAALGVFRAVTDCLATMPNTRALLSLGGAKLQAADLRRLQRPNVEIVPYAHQWRALGVADVFLTHHGLSSTHEAVLHRVPMLSYPFFADQPALAARCQELGLAISLTQRAREAVSAAHMHRALGRICKNREALSASLDRARAWEEDVIAQRDQVLQRIRTLI